jgi:hypothetical protein
VSPRGEVSGFQCVRGGKGRFRDGGVVSLRDEG